MMKLRLVSALAFALLTVVIGWVITTSLRFAPGITLTIAITLAFGAGVWAFVVNQLEAEAPQQYFLKALQYRPLILSFGLFVALVILWGVVHAIVVWAIEPKMDYIPCYNSFPEYPCGDQDVNSDRRIAATSLVDGIFSSIFLIAPLGLAIRRVRKVFQ